MSGERITTAAELDALPDGAVGRWAENGGCVWEKRAGGWRPVGESFRYASEWVSRWPLTVLYRPDQQPTCDHRKVRFERSVCGLCEDQEKWCPDCQVGFCGCEGRVLPDEQPTAQPTVEQVARRIEISMNTPIQYRKRPVVIEAMRFEGDTYDTMAVYQWVEANTQGSFDVNDPTAPVPASGVSIDAATGFMVIATLEGVMQVKLGDYVIKGVQGEFYPCKSDIFEATYEGVADDSVSEVRGGEAS